MHITWKELIVNINKHGGDDLLADWRWLLGDSMQLLVVSALGDMFLADAAGRVHWLDTGTGQLTEVAGSAEEFKRLMQQRENADQWFVPELIGDLIASGLRLGPGQCYSYKKPPVLGGEIQPRNFKPTDLSVHFSVLGQIHQKISELPPGTKISDVRIEDP